MSRKSARIASQPAKPVFEDDGSDEDVQEEVEEEVKPKAAGKKRAAPAKATKAKATKADKGKEKAAADDNADAEEEEAKPDEASNKKQKTAGASPDTSNCTISLATLAEAVKGSRTLKEILTINPSATTTTVTTTTTTTTTPSSTTVVTIRELESAGFEKHFGEIADALLNRSVMFIGGLPHRLLEVEFYCNGYKHVDDFTHCNVRQKTRDQWYFHMTGKGATGGYKGGSYKGLDVTFGDDECYGGILLRALQPLYGDFKPVEGPSLLVDHVLKTAGVSKIEELVAKFDLSAETDLSKEDLAKPKHPLFLVHSDKEIAGLPKHTVYKGARVGLSMKAFSDGKQNYVGKFYRYLITPDKIKKGMHYLIPSLYQQGLNAKEIVTTTKSTQKAVEKYIGLFDGGKKKDYKKFCGVNLSNDEVCEMVGACAAFCYPTN